MTARGKIKSRMNAKLPDTIAPRPQLIRSLRKGFDAVAANIGLLLLPVMMDIFLWLGPHYGIRPIAAAMQANITHMAGQTGQFADLVKANQEIWGVIGEKFNLAIMLRTYPVGVPSLMAGRSPAESPLGAPLLYQVQSAGEGILWLLAFSLIGTVLGSLYFSAIARIVTKSPGGERPRPSWATFQVIILSLTLLAALLVVNIPAFILLSLLSLMSPGITQIAVLVYTLFLIWILVPLVFSPHGIFVYRQNAISSILTSMRLVRFVLPAVSFFIMAAVLLSQGLDLLWESPAVTSWMNLVAIAGHAFITTSLVAASFIFYQDSIQWVQETLQRSLLNKNKIVQA